MLKRVKLGFYTFMFFWHAQRALALQRKVARCLNASGKHVAENAKYLKKITELSDQTENKEA